MSRKIQLRRGPESFRLSEALRSGELWFAEEARKLYGGDGETLGGQVLHARPEEIDAVTMPRETEHMRIVDGRLELRHAIEDRWVALQVYGNTPAEAVCPIDLFGDPTSVPAGQHLALTQGDADRAAQEAADADLVCEEPVFDAGEANLVNKSENLELSDGPIGIWAVSGAGLSYCLDARNPTVWDAFASGNEGHFLALSTGQGTAGATVLTQYILSLVEVEEANVATDFAEAPTDEYPDGWAPHSLNATSDDLRVRADEEASGGKVVEAEVTGEDWHIHRWEAGGWHLNHLITARLRLMAITPESGCAIGARVSWGNILAEIHKGTHLRVWVNGNVAVSRLFPFAAGEWCWVKVRVRQHVPQLQVAAWRAGEPEASWMITLIAGGSFPEMGRVAIAARGPGMQQVDSITVQQVEGQE